MNRAIFTIATKSFLPYARLLHERLRGVGEEAEFIVFVIDHEDGCTRYADESFRVVRPAEFIPEAEFQRMRFAYNVVELSNAAKAFAHQFLLKEGVHARWLYLDADIYPVAGLSEAWAQLNAHPLLITPHVLEPVGARQHGMPEEAFLRFGVYNGGFLGMQAGTEIATFLKWFESVLRDRCLDQWKGLFVDQLWLNFAPIFVPEAKVWRHHGANVAYWNLHERPLRRDVGGSLMAGGDELLFLHFSGLNFTKPSVTSKNAKYMIEGGPLWTELAQRYIEGLRRHGLDAASTWAYSHGRYPSGQPVELEHRRLYVDAWREGTAPQRDPMLLEEYWRETVRMNDLERKKRRLRRVASKVVGKRLAEAVVR